MIKEKTLKKNRGTLKRPGYQPGAASAVLMKYLVKSDMERHAESPVDPSDAFFNSKNVFSFIIKPFASQEYLRLYL
jgi:hypothetical protein